MIDTSLINHDELQCPRAIWGALGAFDLDPCAAITRPEHIATKNWSREIDGLQAEWPAGARVWMFPPPTRWERAATHMADHGKGIALLPAYTHRGPFWAGVCLALFLPPTRFLERSGRPMAAPVPSAFALLAYSPADAELLATSGLGGALVAQWQGEAA